MLQSIRQAPDRFASAARVSRTLLVGLRYHMLGIWDEVSHEGKKTPRAKLSKDPALRELSFTYALIVLCARTARADGPLTREKYVAFREAFPLQDDMCGTIRQLFLLACEDATPLESYAAQIRRSFPRQPELRSAILDRLFAIASAHGLPSRDAQDQLEKIAHLLGISALDYARISARRTLPARPQDVLGVERTTPASIIKKRYRELMQRYHPDRFGGHRISQELEMLLQLRSSEINAAYHHLSGKRAA